MVCLLDAFPHIVKLTDSLQANFPNLRRLFIEARSDNEEREVSRRAVSLLCRSPTCQLRELIDRSWQFYNAVLFLGSVAVFSLIAQRLNAVK